MNTHKLLYSNFLYYLILIFILKQQQQVFCFTNLFNIVDSLKNGKIDSNTLRDKFSFDKPKCLQGSYFYNGSCYFISNHRSSNIFSSSSNLLINQLLSLDNAHDSKLSSLLPTSLQSTYVGTAAVSFVLPQQANWINSSNICKQLNNESTMIYFDNYEEYEFLIKLLFKLKFNNNQTDFMKEEAFYIGLRYNRTWKWLNDLNLTQSFFMANSTTLMPYAAKLPLLHKSHIDYIYRPCAYLYLRGNGEINIDNDNCDRDHKPYICRYVLDRCFNNTMCGQNGECVNLPYKKTFECRCRILYDGKYCEKWSSQGIQMLCSAGLVVGAFILTILIKIFYSLYLKYLNRKKLQKMRTVKTATDHIVLNPLLPQRFYSIEYFSVNFFDLFSKYMKKNLKFFIVLLISFLLACFLLFMVTFARYKQIENTYEKLKNSVQFNRNDNETLSNKTEANDITDKFTKLFSDSKWSNDLCEVSKKEFVEDYMFLFISLPLTLFIYVYNSFWCSRNHTYLCKIGKIKIKHQRLHPQETPPGVTLRSEQNMNIYENYEVTDQVDGDDCSSNAFDSIQSTSSRQLPQKLQTDKQLTLWSKVKDFLFKLKQNRKDETKRIALCCCTCRFDLISPVNPFGKRNRFITAIIYAAYTYNILKIFEYLLNFGGPSFDEAESTAQKLENIKQTLSGIKNPADVSKLISNFGSTIERGILTDLLEQIVNVFIIGLRYYPILLCVEMKHKRALCYFLCSFYMWMIFIFHLYTNTFCLLNDASGETILDLKNSTYSQNLTSFLSQISGKRNLTFVIQPKRVQGHDINQTNVSDILTSDSFASNLVREKRNYILKQLTTINPLDKIKEFMNQTHSNNHTTNNNTNNFDDEFLKQKKLIFLNNILYEKLIFYIVLCIITIHLTVETFDLVRKKVSNLVIYIRKLRRKEVKSKIRVSSILFNDDPNREVIEEMLNEKNDKPIKADSDFLDSSAEILYTKKIFERRVKAKSFIKYLFEKYVYRFKLHFKYSKQLINTYIIAFILLYYLTCILIRKSKLIIDMMSGLLILFINFIFKFGSDHFTSDLIQSEALEIAASTTRTQLNLLINFLFSNIENNIIISCCLTTLIYVIQLLLGIRSYQKHILNAYKGVYVDIPSPKRFTNTKKASSSLHYSGYMIGYLLWGYIILFEVLIVATLIIKFLLKFYFIIEKLSKLFLPILVIFLFKRIFIWYITRYFLIKHKNKRFFLLKNSKLYSILAHFNFFFDCFLGSFVCFMRMAQSSLAALFFMPRLDYSVFGRMLERSDMGFISYVNFIHMEVNQSHPIKIAFCELLVKSIKNKKDKKSAIARNRWFLAIVLSQVQGLYKQRKKYLNKNNRVPKVESFEQFLERKVRLKSIGSLSKMSNSKSTLSLYTVDENRIDNITTSSNATIDSTFVKKKFKKLNGKKLPTQRKFSQDSLN